MNYTSYSIYEAVTIEQSKSFVGAIKKMDGDVAIKRIACLLNSNRSDVTFSQLVGQFLSLVDHETSADSL